MTRGWPWHALVAGLLLVLAAGCHSEPPRRWQVLVTWPQPKMREGRYTGRLSVEAGRVVTFEPQHFDSARGDLLDRQSLAWSTLAGPRNLRSIVVEIEGGGSTRLEIECEGGARQFSAAELDAAATPLGAGRLPAPLLAGYCRIESLAPATIEVRGPSVVRAGVAVEAEVVARAATRGADPARGVDLELELESTDPAAELPRHLPMRAAHATVAITFHTPGLQQLRIRGETAASIEPRAWPVMVLAADDSETDPLFWGDLQAHTRFSSDSAGAPREAYRWAREEAGLDFVAITDHHWSHARNGTWEQARRLAEAMNEPGRFVAFVAVEWGAGMDRPGARLLNHHRHVLFPDSRGGLMVGATDRPAFWRALRRWEGAVAVPHHTGYGVDHLGSDWEMIAEDLEPAVEITSGHGSSEQADSPWPLSRPGGNGWVADAWRRGYMAGVLGGSDNHLGRPGSDVARIHTYALAGLTALRAEKLDRASLLTALRRRASYATMGARRIYLEFSVNGHPMGAALSGATARPREIRLLAGGTTELERIEVLRDEEVWQTATPEGWRFAARWLDERPLEPQRLHHYRVRLIQADGTGAYSSPVFLLPAEPGP
ncbi:MAG: DUF3604 domain-containing protein [Acidobacteriota bacterium]|nr:DUF3604 domain-containing protein [Acidobacteriota bacterium]